MPKTSEETKMASKLDEFDMKAPVADLLYPSVEKHNAMKKRAAALEKLPRAFVNNLELEKVADFITPHYQYRVMRLFCEVCDDEEVINYRLDILDDFIRLPSLSATIRKVINVMVENDRKNIYNLTTPDSFSQGRRLAALHWLAWRDVTEDILNLYRQSCRLKACIFALCTEGTITASINLMEHEIKKNDLIILMPGTILQLNEQVEKVRLCFVGFSSHCVNGINLLQVTMGSFSKIWDNPIVNVSDLIASYFVDYFALLTRISISHPTATSTAMAQSVLHSILLGINALYANRPQSILAKSRKEDFYHRLRLYRF